MQNILEQSHFTPSPNSNIAFAQNWPANIDNLGSGVVQLMKIRFAPNILHLIVSKQKLTGCFSKIENNVLFIVKSVKYNKFK